MRFRIKVINRYEFNVFDFIDEWMPLTRISFRMILLPVTSFLI